MKDRIFVATFSKDALSVAKEFGFGLEINDLCISSNLNLENRERTVERIKREIEEVYGEDWFNEPQEERRKVIIHGPFTELTPAAIDSRAILLMDERYKETLDVCDAFGVKDIVLHDGYLPPIYQKSWHTKKSIDYWKRFSDSLKPGYVVYIENVFDDEPYMLAEILDSVDRDNLKICLDIGHANCMSQRDISVVEWIRVLGSRIGHFHFHNNDGSGDQHNTFDEGSLNIEEIISEIANSVGSEVSITIESRDALTDAKFFQKIL